ncbi:MAG: ArsA family ATPase [Thermoproteota archaeon]
MSGAVWAGVSDGPRVVIVLGKGGVGKTTISIRIAYELAEEGKEVLLASLDPAKHLLEYLELDRALAEKRVAPRLRAIQYELETVAKRVADEYSAILRRIMPGLTALSLDDVVKAVREAPGFEEEVFLRMVSQLYERGDVDAVVVDTPPTGIALRVIALPKLHIFWIRKLAEIRSRIVSIRYAIANAMGRPKDARDPVLDKLRELEARYQGLWEKMRSPSTRYAVVATPEPLPLYEAEAVFRRLARDGMRPSLLVVNKVLGPKAAALGTAELEQQMIARARMLACSVRPPAILALVRYADKPPSHFSDVAAMDRLIEVQEPSCG